MIVALDVDDVVLAFYPSICKKFGREVIHTDIWDGNEACKWIADEFPALYHNDNEFWESLEGLIEPHHIDFEFDYYITAIPDHLAPMRKKNLMDLGFPDKPILCTKGSKLKVMRDHGIDILVDDKPSTVREVNDSGDKIAIQFVPPYMNGKDIYHPRLTVHNISEVREIINKLKFGLI